METTIIAAIIAGFVATTAGHQADGFRDTGCDAARQTPVISERTGEVLYWNNPTCPAGSGATDAVAVDEPAEPIEPDENIKS